MEWDETHCWYHGSPMELTVLRVGSSITPDRELARIFSHKPPMVSIGDDGAITHTGTQPGFLYRIAEVVCSGDVYEHPRWDIIGKDKEYLITRELRVELITRTTVCDEERMSVEEFGRLQARAKKRDEER